MENVISLSSAPAANGQWHSLSMKRIGRWFQLKMDSGEGRYYNETWGSLHDSQFFNLKRDQIVSGSLVKFRPNANFHGKDLRDSKWQFSSKYCVISAKMKSLFGFSGTSPSALKLQHQFIFLLFCKGNKSIFCSISSWKIECSSFSNFWPSKLKINFLRPCMNFHLWMNNMQANCGYFH